MTRLSDDERLIEALSTHWIKYVPQGVFCNFLAAVAILLLISSYISLEFSSYLSFALACIAGLLFLTAHHVWFHKVLSEEFIDIILTSERIIYFNDCLFLCDNEHEIPLHRIAGVEVKQEGLVQNILNYGTIWIDTGGGMVDLKRSIPNVPHPEKLGESIAKMAHAEAKEIAS